MNAIARARRPARTLATYMRVEFASNLQYRFNLFVWMLTWSLQVVVMLAVWQAVADTQADGSVGNFDAGGFAAYYLLMLVLRMVTTSWSSWLLAEDIRSGHLSQALLRPASIPLVYWGRTSGARIVQLFFAVPLCAVCWMLFDADFSGGAAHIAIAIAILPLATTVSVLSDLLLLGIPAFWLTRVSGFMGVVWMVTMLFAGMIAPLPLLPDGIRHAAYVLPFYWTQGYPAQLMSGAADPADAWIAFAMLFAWWGVCYALLRALWPIAMRRYEGVGG